jgi:cobalt/nickel transport system ATP-binding protein
MAAMNTPAIAISALSYRYPDGRPALRGVDLHVQTGERVALVGPNGAGKSTLLLHLNGILQGQGQIEICGLALEKKNLGRIRALVGLVFQSPDDQLFSPTVYEDVAYGPVYMGLPRAEIDERVQAALAAVGMQAYAGRSSTHLSLGEKKRIAIASVLSMQAEILALDEPTAGMDPRARRSLIELLASLPQTLLVATHDLDLVQALLPRTVVLDEGQVAADGCTAQLLSDGALLDRHGLR